MPEPTPTLEIPLPRFRQPRPPDPELPEVDTTTDSPLSDLPGPESPNRRPGPSPDDDPLPPLELSPDHRTRTGISSRPGDPKVAREVFAGLIALFCGFAYAGLARRGLWFRQPTERQIDDVATPLGKILARHLPTDVIGPDFIDATHAAGAAHRYILDGPIVGRYDAPLPEEPQ
jgi:hypothetical protein